VFGELYDTNPRFLLSENDLEMVSLWRLFQGSEFASGYLPDSGGVMEQPAIMMDAFAVMNHAEAELTKKS
jgi:hypothetical protein